MSNCDQRSNHISILKFVIPISFIRIISKPSNAISPWIELVFLQLRTYDSCKEKVELNDTNIWTFSLAKTSFLRHVLKNPIFVYLVNVWIKILHVLLLFIKQNSDLLKIIGTSRFTTIRQTFFYETPYECQCFEFTVGNEQWEFKSKFTIGNSFESINNALQRITLSFEVIKLQ